MDLSKQRLALTLAAALLMMATGLSEARVFSSVGDALQSAFPDCDVERETVFLTTEQVEKAGKLSGLPAPSALVHPYVATCSGRPGGTAYFDAHRVRTLPETLLVVIDARGAVERVEVLSFDEPEEYIPRSVWYEQFDGERLDDDLELARGIDGVTGATLTARATTNAVRRVLAVHMVLEETAP